MDKPFIQLFKTPNAWYFYDANTSEIIPISRESYKYLCAVATCPDSSEHTKPQELVELEKQGYLSCESRVAEIRHPYSEHLELFLKRKIAKITLQLTQSCNFRCKYCIYSEDKNARQRSHSSKHMSWETAKKAIDFLWEHSVDSKSINIGFYGGEPLLEFPLLQRIVDYSKERFIGKKLTFAMTTNGSLLTDDIIHYLENHRVTLLISIDGPKEINDRNRVFADGSGTYDTVAKQIHRIKEIAPEYAKDLSISMVIDPENDFDCINTICLDDSDFSSLNISTSTIDREYDKKTTQVTEEYSMKAEYQRFLSVLSHYGRYPRDSVSPIALRLMQSTISDSNKVEGMAKLHYTDAPSGPCIPGQMRLFVNVDEQLFPCERVSERSSATCLGTLDNGFDFKKTYEVLNIGQLTEDKCMNCWCIRHCSLCAKKADDGAGSLSADEKLSYCDEAKRRAYRKIKEHIFLQEAPQYYPQQIRLSDS